jgi:DUF4097 and DUF4098 domain-containing protein YvlB
MVHEFQTPEPITAIVELVAGEAYIIASDREDTVVEVSPSDDAKRDDVNAAAAVRVEFSAGTLLVKATRRWRSWSPFGYGGSVSVRIELPTGSRLSGETSMGEFRCTGELRDCRLKSSLGDLHVERADDAKLTVGAGNVLLKRALGDVELSVASGEIRAEEIDGGAAVRNANGDTRLGRVNGELGVKAANGDIEIDRAGGALVAKTANGDVRVGEAAGSSVVAESGYGAVEIGVRDGMAAWLDLHTGYGRLQNMLEAAGAPGPDDSRIEIRARTGCGDITIRRSYPAAGED